MNTQETNEQTDYTLAQSLQLLEAEEIFKILEESGFSEQQIALEPQNLPPKLRGDSSQRKKGAKGGAIAGAAFGVFTGLSLDLIAIGLPEAHPTFSINLFLAPVIGGIVGACAIALVGAIAGQGVPKTDPQKDAESLPFEYRVKLVGQEEDFKKAAEILVDRGIQVAWTTK
jgi:hypothetical protein